MPSATLILFWLSMSLLIYTYAGFPLLLAVVGRFRNRRVRQAPLTPSVTLLIAAFNEEEEIACRLENALALDYPREALEIIVASDGSTDATEEIVAAYASRGVRLLRLPRQGKVHALNAAVRESRGEILAFSDANTLYHPLALRKLVRNFADPQVGGVAGNTGYRLAAGSDSTSRGENLYWIYDRWLKRLETRAGSTISAHGGIYALRRELYQPLDDAAVTDDFVISSGVVEQGFRLVFESEALAQEVAVPRAGLEFQRKVRIISTGLRGVWKRRALLNPVRYGFYAVQLFSHKILRRLVPGFLVMLFLATLALVPHGGLYAWAGLAQAVFYALAGAGYLLRRRPFGRRKWLYVPFFYCLANAAALVALVRLVQGNRIELWQPQRQA
jgi:cellulose synthase/poly-beta-1,6-N-acetylglucosamine synthase-like glycosyltransferase